MIKVTLFHYTDHASNVTATYLDAWSLDTKIKVVPCFFSIDNKQQAFVFIKELKVLGAHGKKTEAVLNGTSFIVLFTDGEKVLKSEWKKLKKTSPVYVVHAQSVIGNPYPV